MYGQTSLLSLHPARLIKFPARFLALALAALVAGSCTPAAETRLTLRNVVLYQNGIGYFEHRGLAEGARVDLSFRRYEIGDVLKTITIVPVGEQAGAAGSAVAAITTKKITDGDRREGAGADGDSAKGAGATGQPAPAGSRDDERIALSVALTAAARELAIAYAVPTPAWKPSYRIVLPDERGAGEALLQGWATINNTSDADWRGVQLTLATGAPLSFAIDLLTPQFIPRPDLTGTLVKPVATGAVGSISALSGDKDGDGIPDLDDLCPDDPEDMDGFEDKDGCSDRDNDKDRILDTDDLCVNEPETYNGIEDSDGCPDRGRVVVTDTKIEILDKVYFKNNSATVRPESMPIVQAIAATLLGNPDITALEVQGHAAGNEKSAWSLARRRAASVQTLLRARGVQTRLVVTPYGASQPLDSNNKESGRAKNRRVEFLIMSRSGDEAPGASSSTWSSTRTGDSGSSTSGRVTRRNVQKSVRARVKPRDVAGTVRYEIADPVTIPRGSSALVPIINQQVAGEDIFLYRPDREAPASSRHPWRAARIDNSTGLELQPGPVAIFSQGAFVGEGVLKRLHDREVSFIPYAIDSSCTITSHSDRGERPVRIVTVAKGVVTVQNRELVTTRYEVRTGAKAPARVIIHHPRAYGFKADDLPPGSKDDGGFYLVPLPIQAGKKSVLEIVEKKPVRRTIRVLGYGAGKQLAAYIEGSDLPKAVIAKLEAVLKLRAQLEALDSESNQLRRQLIDVGARADEVRMSLEAIGKTPKAGDLRKRLLKSLTETTAKTEALSRDLAARSANRAELRVRLTEAIHELSYTPEAKGEGTDGRK